MQERKMSLQERRKKARIGLRNFVNMKNREKILKICCLEEKDLENDIYKLNSAEINDTICKINRDKGNIHPRFIYESIINIFKKENKNNITSMSEIIHRAEDSIELKNQKINKIIKYAEKLRDKVIIKNSILTITKTKGNSIFKNLPMEIKIKIATDTSHNKLEERKATKLALKYYN